MWSVSCRSLRYADKHEVAPDSGDSDVTAVFWSKGRVIAGGALQVGVTMTGTTWSY